MSLDLSPDLERVVRERAAAEGVSVEDLLRRTYAGERPSNSSEERVRMLLAEWQGRDAQPPLPASPNPGPGTSAKELFNHWREEDQAMTKKEREAEDRLWEEVQRGIEETRVRLGMSSLLP